MCITSSAQRNMYLTGFTLFLSIILTRTFYILLDLVHVQNEYSELKKAVRPIMSTSHDSDGILTAALVLYCNRALPTARLAVINPPRSLSSRPSSKLSRRKSVTSVSPQSVVVPLKRVRLIHVVWYL